jgi:iron complex transport system ATP-binding protein
MMPEVLLDAQDLDVRVGGAKLLRQVSISLAAGEFVLLAGPNGAGKTTLLKTLAGLLPFQGGRLSFPQSPRGRLPGQIAYLEQGGQIHWPMSVRDVVSLGRIPFGVALQRPSMEDESAILSAMSDCGVSGLARQSSDRLSGGETARVLLARALAVRAPILLVDEPIASLDPAHQIATMQVLEREARRGCAVLAVLHDLPLGLRFADRVLVMEGGQVVADAPPARILADKCLDRVFGVEFRVQGHGRDLVLTPRIQATRKP